jgi:membrane fusion protein (multidrug efflux system)
VNPNMVNVPNTQTHVASSTPGWWPKLWKTVTPLVILLLASAILFGTATRFDLWNGSRTAQRTDDAQLRADVTPLSTKSSGIVAAVLVSDYQQVKMGDLLVQIRDDDFRAQVELAEAAVVAAEAALTNIRKQRELQTARIAEAHANMNAAKPDVVRTRLELIREQTLEGANASTKQKLEVAEADYNRLAATLTSREAELETQRKQVDVLDAQQTQLVADLRAKQASLKVAQVNLDYTRIEAPTDGIVGERKVRPGQLVSAGTQVVSLVGRPVWVVANYKESQLPHVVVGDAAEVTVDGIPGAVWSGHVDTISPASGSTFSLLPPDNATGNFTKIAQRIPVKIVIDGAAAEDPRLRAGMSAIATIKIRP